jgi:hypothetical protein
MLMRYLAFTTNNSCLLSLCNFRKASQFLLDSVCKAPVVDDLFISRTDTRSLSEFSRKRGLALENGMPAGNVTLGARVQAGGRGVAGETPVTDLLEVALSRCWLFAEAIRRPSLMPETIHEDESCQDRIGAKLEGGIHVGRR